MSTQVGGDYVHTLSKEAQLVEPLRNTAPKAMHEEESLCGPLRMNVNHTDAPETLGTTSSRHVDGAPVEFDIECHNFSTLKRVVKGQCSCRPWRESIHTKPEKVKCKCTKVPPYEKMVCPQIGANCC